MKTRKCIKCKTNPVFIRKRGLCRACYQRLRYLEGPFISGPKLKNRNIDPNDNNSTPLYRWIRYQRRLRKRYGDEFIHDLFVLKSTPFKTLQELGNKYGVSREYIRQTFKNYFGFAYTESIQHKREIVNSDVAPCEHDPRYRVAESPNGSTVKYGAKRELEFWKLCEKKGFDVQNSCSKSIDLVVNGFNVDVKSCLSPYKFSPSAKAEYYRYGASKNEMAENDFFACYRPDMDKYVIIPNTISKCYQNGRFWFYMSIKKSNWPTAQNKYWEYIERYDLLELQN